MTPLQFTPLVGLAAFQKHLQTLKPKDGSREIWLKHGHNKIFVGEWDNSGQFEIYKTYGKEADRKRGQSVGNAFNYLFLRSQDEDGGVFFVPTQPQGNPLAELVTSTDDIGIELDSVDRATQEQRYQQFTEITGLYPSVLLTSGGKSIHWHAKLDQHLPIEQASHLRRLTILAFRGDPVTERLHQPMRIAGFYRREKQQYQELLYANPQAQYSYEEYLEGLRKWFAFMGWSLPDAIPDEWWSRQLRPLLAGAKNKLTEDEKVAIISDRLAFGYEAWQAQQEYDRQARAAKAAQRAALGQVQGTQLSDLVAEADARLGADAFNLFNHDWKWSGSEKARGACPFHQSQSGNSAWLAPKLKGEGWAFSCFACTDNRKMGAFAYWLAVKRGLNARFPDGKEYVDLAIEFLQHHAGVTIPDEILNYKPKNKQQQRKVEIIKAQQQLNSFTYEPTLRLNQRYLSDIHLPESGYLFIDSLMGSGKTTQLANLKKEYRSRHPQGKIRSIGHRNGLLRQTGEKLGIPLLVDLDFDAEHGKLTSTQVSKLEAIGLCINSLLRLDIDSLDGALLIFDEVDAILKSLLTSKLLKRLRAQIMAHIQRIVRHVLKTGGYIVAMEANLTDLSIDFLRGIGGTEHPMQLVCNEWRGQPWDVTIYSTSGSTWLLSVADFPGRQVVVSDSQKFGEELERYMRGSGKKVIRVDGKTAERPDIRALLANPDESIRAQQPDTLILSPTLESGGDIAILDYFDRVAFNLCSLETRSQMQMLGRVRAPIPRVGIIGNPGGSDEAGRSLNPDTIKDDLYRNAEALATFTQLAQVLETQSNSGDSEAKTYRDRLLALLDPNVDSPEGFWLDAYCKFRARENGARAAMADNLIAALEAAGHAVKTDELAKDKEHSEIRAKIREELERKEAGQLTSADGDKFSPSEAREVLEKPGTTEEDRFAARKTILQDGLPGVELTEDFIYKAAIQERGSFLKAATLLWQSKNIEIARELDRRAFTRELEKPFVFLADLRTRSLKADLLNRSGLVDLIGDRTYTEADEDVQKFKRWAIWNRFEIKRLLGMTISDKQTAIKVFCKFARKLGYSLEATKKGGRGEQVRHYFITNLEDADRTAILEALTRKYAELALTEAQNVSSSDTVSTTFLSNKPLREVDTGQQKVVDTGGAVVDEASIADVTDWLTTAAETGDCAYWEIARNVIVELGDNFKRQLWERLDRRQREAVYRFEGAIA